MNNTNDRPLHDQTADLALEVSDLLIDVARISGRLAELHHRLWHLTRDTDPQTVEDATN